MEQRHLDRRKVYSRQEGRGCLEGVRILIAEDEALIAMELISIFEDVGATVVGPCRTLSAALARAQEEGLSAAILDLRLGRDSSTPLARVLAERRIPFFFYSGQAGNDPIRAEWPDSILISKPAKADRLIDTAVDLLKSR